MFQDFKLLPNRNTYQNVAYALEVQGQPRHEIDEKVPEILQLVGLGDKFDRFPHELSGGEQQRVSIARAFVNHPPLLICDEPTGNLDPDTSVGIMQLLYRINRTGTTVVMATHDREMVDRMRRRVSRSSAAASCATSAAAATWRPEMRRPGFFLVEAVRALRNNLATTVAATVTVLIVLYFLGVFVLFGTYLYAKVDKERSGVRVTVYLDKRATRRADHGDRRAPAAEPGREAERASSTSPRPRPGSAAQEARPEDGLGERPDEPAAGLLGGLARRTRAAPRTSRPPCAACPAPRRARTA